MSNVLTQEIESKSSELSDLQLRRSKYRNQSYILHYEDAALGIEIYINLAGTVTQGWSGRKEKSSFHYRFEDPKSTLNFINSFIQKCSDHAREKEKVRLEKKSATRDLVVGDVLVSSWGYEQTNIDYYQVIRLAGKVSVVLQQIAKQSTPHNHTMTGKCTPLLNSFIGDEFTAIARNGRVKLTSFSSAVKKPYTEVGGMRIFEPDTWTSYA